MNISEISRVRSIDDLRGSMLQIVIAVAEIVQGAYEVFTCENLRPPCEQGLSCRIVWFFRCQ